MEAFFVTLFDDVRHERSLILILSPTHSDILKQINFTDLEINEMKIPAPEKLSSQTVKRKCCTTIIRIVFSV